MERAKDSAQKIVAGGIAGFVEVLIMHPLDLAKTRLQLGKSYYSGLTDVFQKTLAKEGVRGFYKGILPPSLAATPKRATKFFSFEEYKKLFISDHLPGWATLSLAGLCSGMTEAIIVTPFEVIKVRLQADYTTPIEKQRSTASMAREIIRSQGLRKGLYRGFSAMLFREGIWNMFYFGVYFKLKYLAIEEKVSPLGNISSRLFFGFLAGTTASIVCIPFDVAKSRIQALPADDPKQRYHKTFDTIHAIRTEEGSRALCRGLLPKVMRLGPGGGIMLLLFENIYEWLKVHT